MNLPLGRRSVLIACAAALISGFASTSRGENLTYVDLINRLTDVKHLAVLPEKGERVEMASSFNRRSRYDESSDRYIDWGANDDGGRSAKLQALPDGSVVLADIKGPGVVWRTWAALAGKGKVKMYVDGGEKPVVDLPFDEWFKGAHAPFNRKGLTYPVASGNDSYVPIPFNQSLRIVGEKGWGDYFQFTHQAFPAGTNLPSFKRELSNEENAALDRASETLLKPAEEQGTAEKDAKTEKKEITIEPGASINVVELAGAGAITSIKAQVVDTIHRADQIKALRELTLAIHWDGSNRPAVWSPLGDFFGTSIGANEYQSAMTGVKKDGALFSRWYMPYGNGAAITISNDGPIARKVTIEVTHAPLTQPIESLGRFHAKVGSPGTELEFAL